MNSLRDERRTLEAPGLQPRGIVPPMSDLQPLRIAVIGGGLTGLAAAHRLSELATEQRRVASITVFEAGPGLGGIVGTVERDGYLIDTGADSFITNKPGALALCRRIGLESRLQATEPQYRGALVLHNGRLLAQGSVAEIQANPAVKAIYVGSEK